MLHDILLLLHFIGLAMGIGTSFATFRLGLATQAMEKSERTRFMLTASALGKNGSIGLALLILTGVGLMFDSGPANVMTRGGGAFHVKLTLVVILSGLFGYSQVLVKKARLSQGGPAMATLPKVGLAMLVVGILTIVCAVFAFH